MKVRKDLIRAARLKLGLSQEGLARIIGRSNLWMCKFENALGDGKKTDILLSTFERVVAATGLSKEEVIAYCRKIRPGGV